MGLAVGDYAQLARRQPPLLRRGTRGTVVRIEGDFSFMRLPDDRTFEVPTDNLIRLVPGEENK
jgi:hypothetical protein